MAKVYQRKQTIVESWRESSRTKIAETEGVDLLMGEARFTGPRTLEVRLNDGRRRQLGAETIIINTGARPRVPEIEGLDQVSTLNSTSIMELEIVPDHLLIVGGGYIGVEFGHMFRRFGSEVTLIQHRGQLLTREDADVAQELTAILREDGITVLLDTSPVSITQAGNGNLELTVRTSEGERTLHGSHVLLAAGRVPNTEQLDLAAAGVETDARGRIKVNDSLETTVRGIYALGDVKGGPAFTHISYDDFRVLCANLLEDQDRTIAGRVVPYTVFSDPELGRVGLTEKAAREQARDIVVAKMPMSHVARAIELDETRGLMKVVLDAENGQILGCAILGVWGGEIMSLLQVAMMGGLPYTALRDGVFSHPTLAESLNNLFATVDDSLVSQITRRTQRTGLTG
jgi:pyruvate/2-oxoglutarate dehydrogenase complex dihydrolipoamide dehydrogenase (E3) component